MNLSIPTKGWCSYRDGVVIPGVATVRLPDIEGQHKIRTTGRAAKHGQELAVAAGMTFRAFKRLSVVDKSKIRWAYLLITSPTNCGVEPDPGDWQEFEAAILNDPDPVIAREEARGWGYPKGA